MQSWKMVKFKLAPVPCKQLDELHALWNLNKKSIIFCLSLHKYGMFMPEHVVGYCEYTSIMCFLVKSVFIARNVVR